MKLNQKRIRNTNRLLVDLSQDEEFLIGVKINEDVESIVKNELNVEINLGVLILPNPTLGLMCRRNAIGDEIIRKDLQKEVVFWARDWQLPDRRGTVHYGTNYMPYSRFPRDFIPPKEMNLKIIEDSNKNRLIVINNIFVNNNENNDELKFAANLILEIFSEVDTFIVKEGEILSNKTIERVNWEILPKGEHIWDRFQSGKLSGVSPSEIKMMKERFDYIENYSPDNSYQGVGGYSDYVVFEFLEKNIYVFESVIYGNATYIFEGTWKEVSKLSKKEILDKDLALGRIIHNNNWKDRIYGFLNLEK